STRGSVTPAGHYVVRVPQTGTLRDGMGWCPYGFRMDVAVAGDEHNSFLGRIDVVLGAFDAEHPALTLGGLMARTQLPKTTVFRVVSQLARLGWVEHDGGRYVVGSRLFELGSLATIRTQLAELVRPFLQEL